MGPFDRKSPSKKKGGKKRGGQGRRDGVTDPTISFVTDAPRSGNQNRKRGSKRGQGQGQGRGGGQRNRNGIYLFFPLITKTPYFFFLNCFTYYLILPWLQINSNVKTELL